VQTADFCGGDLDGPAADPHGTAVAEVIHDMAPGADLLADTDEDGFDDNLGNAYRGPEIDVAPGASACAFLRWDAWPLTSQDLDLALVASGVPAEVWENDNRRQRPARLVPRQAAGGCLQTTVFRPECTGVTVSVGIAPSLSATR
jgi:hypothetical protein